MTSTARVVSLSVLTTLIIFLGITFYQVVAPFLLPLFLAGVMTILAHPLFIYFERKTHDHTRVAAGLTTATVMLLLLVPLLVGIVLAALQLHSLANERVTIEVWSESIESFRETWSDEHVEQQLIVWLQPFSREEITLDEFRERSDVFKQRLMESAQETLRSLAGRTLGLAGATLGLLEGMVGALIGFVMFGIALYYYLADGPSLLAAAESLIPVHADYQRQLVHRFEKVVRAVVLATLASAIAQGLATAVLLYLAGIRHFFIIFMVTTCTAVIPLAGTWVVWGPCAVWLLWQGQWGAALFVVAVGAAVIGTMDNLIKTYVLHSDAKLHPLLAFISVLGGLKVMGLWGVFIGPIVASCLHALVQIFNVELKALSEERRSQASKKPKSKSHRNKRSHSGDPPQAAGAPEPSTGKQRNSDSTADEPQPRKRRRRRRRRKRRDSGSEPQVDKPS